ncbi:hypothetical protein C2845_PM09G23770 [Panicum miliaceum]|uniref:At1g61320/AtMIF1 LRR domain-containing protein n=1 Tax=Panicum miliaceum TaxID=4540 RepID=A0A3L6S532_PANMI|nr:hypothetical protein C2845_PM09G23770 [Panicum miliaceum]
MQDIWRHIHSTVPLCDAARASCVSRAFLHSWRCRPNLILNRDTLRSKAHVSGANFSHTLDCILRRHSGVGVKTLQLVLDDIANNGDLDSWLQEAVAPGIEELVLLPISEMIKYNFPCSLLSEGIRNSIRHLTLGYCAFRPTPELGPLRSLTSLCLDTVGITGYPSPDPAQCGKPTALGTPFIPCELQQLSSLRVCGGWRLKVIESKAPNLSNLAITGKVKLSGETLQMKHLSMLFGNVVCYARSELPSILPNLETLELTSGYEVPFILQVTQQRMRHASVFGDSSSLRQIDEHKYCCLKSVKISGFTSAKSLVELTCHILKNAVSLESVTLDTLYGWRCSEENRASCNHMGNGIPREAPRALEAIRTYITDKVPATAKFSVVEPCRRCHKVARS